MIKIAIPDCLGQGADPLQVTLKEGAAEIAITDTVGEAVAVVEIHDLQEALALLEGHDERRAERARAEEEALPERARAAQRELDQITITQANKRIRELLDLLDDAAAENRKLSEQLGAGSATEAELGAPGIAELEAGEVAPELEATDQPTTDQQIEAAV